MNKTDKKEIETSELTDLRQAALAGEPEGSRCTVCGKTEQGCRRDEHEFTRPIPRDTDITPVVAELKDHIRATAREEGEQDG